MIAAILCRLGPAAAQPIAAFVRSSPTGTRSIAMAATGVADASDPANIFVNPANAAFARGLSITGGFDNWEPDVNHFDFGVSGGRAQTSAITIGAALTHTRADVRILDPETNLQVQNHASYMTTSAGAGWVGAETSVALGAAVKWSTDDGGGPVAFDLGVNVGAHSELESSRLHFAIAANVRDLGTDDDSSVFTDKNTGARYWAGASFRIVGVDSHDDERHSATLNLDTIDLDDAVAGGVEVVGWNILSLRYGYGDRAIVGLSAHTFGGGITGRAGLFTIRIDYARLSASDADARLNAFGTTMSFNW